MPRKPRQRSDKGNGCVSFVAAKGLWYGTVSGTVNGKRTRRSTQGATTKTEATTRLRRLQIRPCRKAYDDAA
jgi:hypothetical protein